MRKARSISFLYISILIVTTLLSCGGGGDGSGEGPPEEQSNPPAKAIGTLPANGEPCSDYEEVANDDLKVLVAFKWNAAQLAQNYNLVITQGSTQVFENSFTALEAKVELDRGKTYSWSITSINGDGETKGDTYSFTTPGIPEGNFAPYAAEISIEFNAQTSELSISWVGSDEDNDELTYDITVWEDDMVLVEENDLNQMAIDPIVYKNGAKYAVEVLSKDPSGSFSVSKTSDEAPE